MEEGSVSTESAASSVHRSLGFGVLLDRLRAFQPCRLLDLGTATSENVAFLTSLPARLTVADVPGILAEADRGPRSPAAFGNLLERGMPPLEASSVDVILIWDLLNYLTPREIEKLGRFLLTCTRPRSLLFALISTLPEIPDEPQRFRIVERESLGYETRARYRRKGPQYNEPDLCRWLPAFEVDTSFLLRNGMKEYIFSVRATAPSPPPQPGRYR